MKQTISLKDQTEKQSVSLSNLTEKDRQIYRSRIEKHFPIYYDEEKRGGFIDELFKGMRLKSLKDTEYSQIIRKLKRRNLILGIPQDEVEDGVVITYVYIYPRLLAGMGKTKNQ